MCVGSDAAEAHLEYYSTSVPAPLFPLPTATRATAGLSQATINSKRLFELLLIRPPLYVFYNTYDSGGSDLTKGWKGEENVNAT